MSPRAERSGTPTKKAGPQSVSRDRAPIAIGQRPVWAHRFEREAEMGAIQIRFGFQERT